MISVSDFISESRDVLKDIPSSKTNKGFSDSALIDYLESSLIELQKDKPIFTKEISLTVDPTKKRYEVKVNNTSYNVHDSIVLYVDDEEFTKVNIFSLYDSTNELGNNCYAIENNELVFKEALDAKQIKFVFWEIRVDRNMSKDTKIDVPIYFLEPLRLLFLSRCFENLTDKRNRETAKFYITRYEMAIEKTKRSSKKRHKNVSSTYQII